MSMISKLTSSDTSKSGKRQALSPFDEMDRYFDTLFQRGWMRPFSWDMPKLSEFYSGQGMLTPKVDVIDREKDILVRAEVPGVDKDKLDVTVSDNAITIKGTVTHEEKEEQGDYYRRETSFGEFVRTVALPAKVDNEHVQAKYKDGILEVVVQKTQQTQRRTIKVE